MKFTISSSLLLKELSKISNVISGNSTLPILYDYLFDAKINSLTIFCTDLQTSIKLGIDVANVNCQEPGTVAIPAKILNDTLKAMPDQPISIKATDNNIEITGAYGKYKMAGDNANDYPTFPDLTEDITFPINSTMLVSVLKDSVNHTSSDELRLAMTGIYVSIDMPGVQAVSTDAHKLMISSYCFMQSNETTSFIIPKKTAQLLIDTLPSNEPEDEDDLIVSISKNNALFTFSNTSISCRLIDAKYPSFTSIIPTEFAIESIVSLLSLTQSIKRLLIYANKTTNKISLTFTKEHLLVESIDPDFSNEASEKLLCNLTGIDEFTIGFNGKLLLELLQSVSSTEVTFKMNAPNKPTIITYDHEKTDRKVTMLIMPLSLQ